MDLITIFVTGLFAGGLTCLAVQGGLLASSVSAQEKNQGEILSVGAFLIARIVAYTLMGFALGALGSVAQVSITTRVILQIGVSIFMIGTALNLLDVHPIFRYFVIQPPKFLTRIVKNQSRSKSIFGPALLGIFTVFIPCGATQAMMAYAVASGSTWLGGVIMFVFILGTSPLFLALGYAAKRIGGMSANFNKIAAVVITLVAIYNISGAVALSGFDYSNRTIQSGATVDEATIYFTQGGYQTEPATLNVKAGSQVKIRLVNKNAGGCIQAFNIPKLKIQRIVGTGKSEEISFVAPSSPETITFMCSMGMYRGVINVI